MAFPVPAMLNALRRHMKAYLSMHATACAPEFIYISWPRVSFRSCFYVPYPYPALPTYIRKGKGERGPLLFARHDP